MSTLSSPSPAESLSGHVLQTGWVVGGKLAAASPNHTGGNFSTGYSVEKDGRKAFLKATDIYRLLRSTAPADLMQAMNRVSAQHLHERLMLEASAAHNMDRVVQTLEASQEQLDPGDLTSLVFYFVFEMADGDIRRTHDAGRVLDLSRVFGTLHCVATGVKQLHTAAIAHQDIKPSNILQFSADQTEVSRIGDLGRASTASSPMGHDNFPCAGDPNYWPPEALYHQAPPNWDGRRACDLFQLGSLMLFLITGVHATNALMLYVQDAYVPYSRGGPYTGTFVDALPTLRAALNSVCEDLPDLGDRQLGDRVIRILRELCAVDPDERGHPRNAAGDQRSVERYITEFNLLARRYAMMSPILLPQA